MFSFSPNKIITTGQGGLLITNNAKIYKKIKMFKNQGRSVQGSGGDDDHIIRGSFKINKSSSSSWFITIKKNKKKGLKY